MPAINDIEAPPAKALLLGKSGAGKTGALASLVCEGYNLRMIDTDKGIRTLRSLLTDHRYPYAKLIEKRNIDLMQAVRYIPIDIDMRLRTIQKRTGKDTFTTETLLAPVRGDMWTKTMGYLDKWRESNVDLGPVTSWGPMDVLALDSFSTLAKCAYYFAQAMNGRLGSPDQGNDYRRDVGEAQSQLTRLLELLHSSSIKCNVIVISHITWVDESQGVASRPKDGEDGGIISMPDGYPSAIGRALSPHMGKYFNDAYISRSEGTGMGVKRTISTVPQDGVIAKNSVYLNREYTVQSGLAEIFAALRELPPPLELIEACKPQQVRPMAKPTLRPAVSPKVEPLSAPVVPV
jgi:hypothetical protein